jgi:hypothetical protein
MKTYAFNLLPQKSRALVKKEDERDNYALLITLFPLMGVIIWLSMILINGLVIDYYQKQWEQTVSDRYYTIEYELAPILIQHGELVQKTNALETVITKDIAPEQLFVLLDEIYSNQDSTFSIIGYGRKENGAFLVNLVTQNYKRFAEITRRFSTYKYINNVKIENASVDNKSNTVTGSISFFFNYEEPITTDNTQL